MHGGFGPFNLRAVGIVFIATIASLLALQDSAALTCCATESAHVYQLVASDLFVTHVQVDRLQATTDPAKRSQFLGVFAAIPSTRVPTESGAWEVFEWDEFKWALTMGCSSACFNR